jgi:hypothetical protein
MSSPMPSPLAGAEQDTAQKAPDLAAIDRAIDHKPAPSGGVYRDASVRTELAMRLFIRDLRVGDECDRVAREAVVAADAFITALEAKHHG